MSLAQEMRKIALQIEKEKAEEVDNDFLLIVEKLIKTKANQGGFNIEIPVRKLNSVTMYQLRSKLDVEGFKYRMNPKDILFIEW